MSPILRSMWHNYRYTFLIYWIIMGLFIVAAQIMVSNTTDQDAVYAGLTNFAPPKYFLSVMGVLFVIVNLPVYVAHGVSRRRYMTGTAVFAALIGATYALISMIAITVNLGFAGRLDGALISRVGFAHLLTDYAYMGAGWLIGVTYYRYGPWYATFLLPFTTSPAWLTDGVFNSLWTTSPFTVQNLALRLPYALAVLAALACIAGAVAAGYALARTVPLKPRRA
ncbi:hypothetical protein [Hamadaea tsunoensis]|uniref:hypothetical protein n=1 Tax=Hamadaea tsunoensis TaxID=53368 RepID=UPI0003FC8207|nr:hypothetical protein [Hamadaea tsunoensis]